MQCCISYHVCPHPSIPCVMYTQQVTNEERIRKCTLTPNGSAFSHEICDPQLAGLSFSGKDSGTATMMNKMSKIAIEAANQMTTFSLYMSCRNAPMAGLVTKLAANVAET